MAKKVLTKKLVWGIGNVWRFWIIPNWSLMIRWGHSCSFRTSLLLFRTFRCPLFPKPVSWLGLFCRFLQQDGSRDIFYFDLILIDFQKALGHQIFQKNIVCYRHVLINLFYNIMPPTWFVWKLIKSQINKIFFYNWFLGKNLLLLSLFLSSKIHHYSLFHFVREDILGRYFRTGICITTIFWDEDLLWKYICLSWKINQTSYT